MDKGEEIEPVQTFCGQEGSIFAILCGGLLRRLSKMLLEKIPKQFIELRLRFDCITILVYRKTYIKLLIFGTKTVSGNCWDDGIRRLLATSILSSDFFEFILDYLRL